MNRTIENLLGDSDITTLPNVYIDFRGEKVPARREIIDGLQRLFSSDVLDTYYNQSLNENFVFACCEKNLLEIVCHVENPITPSSERLIIKEFDVRFLPHLAVFFPDNFGLDNKEDYAILGLIYDILRKISPIVTLAKKMVLKRDSGCVIVPVFGIERDGIQAPDFREVFFGETIEKLRKKMNYKWKLFKIEPLVNVTTLDTLETFKSLDKNFEKVKGMGDEIKLLRAHKKRDQMKSGLLQFCRVSHSHLGKEISGFFTGGVIAKKFVDGEYGVISTTLKSLSQENAEIVEERVKVKWVGPSKSRIVRREVINSLALGGDNVVKCYGFYIQKGSAFIVMEEMDLDVFEFIRLKGSNLTVFEKFKIMEKIAAGLLFLHSKMVVHRDMKPGNVLVSGDGKRVKLCDFGTTKIQVSDRTMSVGRGTTSYFAPERFLNDGTELFKADVYSMALTFYYILFQRRPYREYYASKMSIEEIVVNKEIKPDTGDPDLQELIPEFFELLDNMWMSEPRRRWDSKKVSEWFKKNAELFKAEYSKKMFPPKKRLLTRRRITKDSNYYSNSGSMDVEDEEGRYFGEDEEVEEVEDSESYMRTSSSEGTSVEGRSNIHWFRNISDDYEEKGEIEKAVVKSLLSLPFTEKQVEDVVEFGAGFPASRAEDEEENEGED